MEKDTNKAILVVGISNPNRLNSPVTEDFFLVGIDDYRKATRLLMKYEESDEVADIVDNISSVVTILTTGGIDFEHVIEGRRFFFDNEIEPDACDCDD
jgi:hypothetical protein